MAIRKRASKKAKNGYTYQVYFSYEDKYGLVKNYFKSGFATKNEAKNHEILKKEEFNNKIFTNDEITFEEVFNEYISSLDTKSSTILTKQKCYNSHLKGPLGKISIIKIDFEIIQNLLNEKGKKYSKNTCKQIKSVLNCVFDLAYNKNYIVRKPYSRLKTTGITKDKKQTVTIDQFNMLIEYFSNCNNPNRKVRYDSYIILLYIGLYTGLRIGEALALTREDIDLAKKTLTVNKQFHSEVENFTKTDSSSATIPISGELVKILKKHFEKYPDCDLVCFDANYNYLSYKSAIDKFSVVSDKLGFYFHYHMLRHTFITQLHHKDVSVKNAQTLARHANFNTTMNIYTNLDQEDLSGITDNLFNN